MAVFGQVDVGVSRMIVHIMVSTMPCLAGLSRLRQNKIIIMSFTLSSPWVVGSKMLDGCSEHFFGNDS